MRMRSVGTLVALLAAFAAAILWIPDPAGHASSLSWRFPDGRVQAPIYDAAYIGFAASALIAILVALGGFYLVAGSVRRDRERGVGVILAATPLSNGRVSPRKVRGERGLPLRRHRTGADGGARPRGCASGRGRSIRSRSSCRSSS